MTIFKKYNDFLIEKALFKDGGFDRYDNYISEISDNKKTLENFDSEINLLISLFKDLDYTKIKFSNSKYRDKENYEIIFTKNIDLLILPIKKFLSDIEDQNNELYTKILNTYFNGYEPNFSFDIQIDRNNFNKFHIPVDLPNIFKNLGLGKKIVKAAVNKFEYLLITSTEDSFELKMVVHSISQMKDVFSFMKEKSILIFKNDFEIVKKVLIDFFTNDYNDNYTLDEDFLLTYKDKIIIDEFLSKLYKKYL